MTKYLGNNCDNNRVYVDLKKKTVKFEPVETLTKESLNSRIGGISVTVGLLSFLIAILLTIPYYLITHCMIDGLEWLTFSGLISIALGLGFHIFMLKNEKFRGEFYPKINAFFGGLSQDQTWHEINPEAIIDRKFILPYNAYVHLKYDAKGEYSKYLKSIKLINKFILEDNEFIVVIEWSKKPKKGSMKIQFW